MIRLCAWALAALITSAIPLLAACSDTSVEFRDAGAAAAKARFTVEVADEWPEITLGLMHRESMPRSAGMIFIYPEPRRVSFWMKNTLIPLDMIFIRADGVVTKVHENAIPLDETSILGPADTQYVVEINGGLAAPLGIVPGVEMRYPTIDPDAAAWPCAAS
ncbi:MAG: DUF192 domain-containing protein [Pseudomonadota bacterium]